MPRDFTRQLIEEHRTPDGVDPVVKTYTYSADGLNPHQTKDVLNEDGTVDSTTHTGLNGQPWEEPADAPEETTVADLPGTIIDRPATPAPTLGATEAAPTPPAIPDKSPVPDAPVTDQPVNADAPKGEDSPKVSNSDGPSPVEFGG